MEIVSTIVLTMAWAIPLVVLLFVAWVAMQNIRSARQDKKTKMNGVNVKATILQIKYDRDQRINNHYSAILTLRYHWHKQELQGIRGVIFPAQDQSEVQVNQLINIRVHQDDPQHFYYLDYRNV
ncbi:hypothetical protein VO438_002720 [Klebsiella aerogenes]|nr:hypothetical protein [Klebsiella aerogenes]EMC9821766.1 hypothetical protein [Klebsiella aerogenes]HDU6240151.1 hypothetical protein [Klebsiella aerogenes]HEO9689731.1 hypothetical protein [Klebsiella aerogenes]